ncbi:hypothetical protein HY642_03710 [Candidatus Woesearchaeota archaeon]|nr:hypothetical protein [Candidatus Woesearchaeota archaeon]
MAKRKPKAFPARTRLVLAVLFFVLFFALLLVVTQRGPGLATGPCADECSLGEQLCVGAYAMQCTDIDDDPCAEWKLKQGCPAGKRCVVRQGTADCAP